MVDDCSYCIVVIEFVAPRAHQERRKRETIIVVIPRIRH